MYTIQTLNKISANGLDQLPRDNYEIATEISNPDAILVRSADMLSAELPKKLKGIARAGAGVNNIPVDRCTEKGIVVFNTPGANANAVKEIIIASLLLSSRKIIQGIAWAQTLKGKADEVGPLVEKGKSQFVGPEIAGKKLGVIGLGAIGIRVANDALALGMEVIGFDPFLSVEAAWGISSQVTKAASLEQLIAASDYITIHVPFSPKTKGMINKDKIALMKKGVKLLNFSRGGLVVNADILEAIDAGIVSTYVTDFPDDELLGNDKVIAVPHLGASTPESEENCAVMAAKQLRHFLEYGNIKNSVNFPECHLDWSGKTRITISHDNIPNMVGQITTLLAGYKINIADMLNRSKDKIGYTIIDSEDAVSEELIEKISAVEGIKNVRLIVAE